MSPIGAAEQIEAAGREIADRDVTVSVEIREVTARCAEPGTFQAISARDSSTKSEEDPALVRVVWVADQQNQSGTSLYWTRVPD